MNLPRSGNRVADKVALVTGATRGMGLAHVRLLAEHGACVALTGRNDSAGEALAASLSADGLEVSYLHLDVTSSEQWIGAVARTEERYGKLDILVNNAGLLANANVLDCSLEEWNQVLSVNATGSFLGTKHAAPAMMRAGAGSIINVSSVLGKIGSEYGVAYHASKGAVHLLTRAAAVSLAPTIRVNCVVPAITETDMGMALGSDRIRDRVSAYPLGRAGLPIEVAFAVLFLASDESSFMTGSDIVVDGGALAGVKSRQKV